MTNNHVYELKTPLEFGLVMVVSIHQPHLEGKQGGCDDQKSKNNVRRKKLIINTRTKKR
jgi:hypothetical protein